jgi:four helix bundle protein
MRMASVKRFEDFDAWKLSVELRDLVYRMTETGLKDFKFRDQIRDSASGPPRNIAEGFGRFEPRDFANMMRIAKASLMETKNHLLHGRKENYFTQSDYEAALRLCKRALGATKGLHRYLRSCNGKLPWDPKGKKSKPAPKEPKKPKEPQEPQEPQEPR